MNNFKSSKINIENGIAEFLKRASKHDEIVSEIDIFASGYVNSLFAMQIVMFLQKEFEIVISDSDLKIDNFRNLSAIVDLVRRKRNERATAA